MCSDTFCMQSIGVRVVELSAQRPRCESRSDPFHPNPTPPPPHTHPPTYCKPPLLLKSRVQSCIDSNVKAIFMWKPLWSSLPFELGRILKAATENIRSNRHEWKSILEKECVLFVPGDVQGVIFRLMWETAMNVNSGFWASRHPCYFRWCDSWAHVVVHMPAGALQFSPASSARPSRFHWQASLCVPTEHIQLGRSSVTTGPHHHVFVITRKVQARSNAILNRLVLYTGQSFSPVQPANQCVYSPIMTG